MKKIFLLIVLVPCALIGQLDKISTHITEQEFVSSFPDAKRDLDVEAYWTGGADTINGIEGSSLWLLYNDTVSAYRFLSMKVQGPSNAYPNADSSEVHKMKDCLDKVKAELEKEFGKPGTSRNNSLLNIGKDGINRAYSVIWTFPGTNDYIQLSISTDLSSGNFINAPGKYTVVESQSYEMRIEVTHRNDYTMLWHDIGKSSERFYTIYKNFRAPLIRDKIYMIKDTAVSQNAEWTVKFTSGKLVSLRYSATTGTGYRAKTDADAYTKLKTKATQLLGEGDLGYGKADSLSNLMTPKYKPHERQLAYHVDHLYARWKTADGKLEMTFEETGGGKNPDTYFVLEVNFFPGAK